MNGRSSPERVIHDPEAPVPNRQRVCMQCKRAPGTLVRVGSKGDNTWRCAQGCSQQSAFEAIADTVSMMREGVRLSAEDRKNFNAARAKVREANRTYGNRRHQNRGAS